MKYLSILMVLAALFCLTIPALAENETSDDTVLNFLVASSWEVSIPASLSFTSLSENVSVPVTATKIFLADGELLTVKFAGFNGEDGNAKKMFIGNTYEENDPYIEFDAGNNATIGVQFSADDDIDDISTSGVKKDIVDAFTITDSDNATKAGNYTSGSLTFIISSNHNQLN